MRSESLARTLKAVTTAAGARLRIIMTPAWTVSAWPTALWPPGSDLPLHFVHLGTHVANRLGTEWPRMGQTVWGGRAGEAAAGVSWDWIEIAEGIVAIADPMMMSTNLRLLGTEGEILTSHEAAPHLNRLVRSLPWQAEVWQALQTEPRTAPQRPDERAARGSAVGLSLPIAAGPSH